MSAWLDQPMTTGEWLMAPIIVGLIWILWKLLTDNTKWGGQ